MVRTVFPNVFQQGNMPIYALVYQSQHKTSESRELLSQEGDSQSDRVYSKDSHLLGSWLTPRYQVKRQEGSERNFLDPVLYLLYCLKFWELLAERAENLALFFETCLTFLLSCIYAHPLFSITSFFFLIYSLSVLS